MSSSAKAGPARKATDKDARHQLGRVGEEWAARLLQEAGLEIVARNWRCSYGELDLVAHEVAPDYAKGGAPATWLVVVEVRIRRGVRFGSAQASVTPAKQAKLRQVAEAYVQSARWQGPWRIDVVAIQLDGQGHLLEQLHLRHAVMG
jgi:putative endonuclease